MIWGDTGSLFIRYLRVCWSNRKHFYKTYAEFQSINTVVLNAKKSLTHSFCWVQISTGKTQVAENFGGACRNLSPCCCYIALFIRSHQRIIKMLSNKTGGIVASNVIMLLLIVPMPDGCVSHIKYIEILSGPSFWLGRGVRSTLHFGPKNLRFLKW